jgi:hypothetical protein
MTLIFIGHCISGATENITDDQFLKQFHDVVGLTDIEPSHSTMAIERAYVCNRVSMVALPFNEGRWYNANDTR